MPLVPGTRLGPYEVVAQIGEGGMGQVYRATDTKLKRSVAIKVLPASVAGDRERLARFQREAEVLAALNHPHIAQVYGFEDGTDVKALVMELVDGPTLADRIAQGPIPLDEALPIARQIADALEAAHERGIVHRDLKPANVKVKDDGTVKVLDFGLARVVPGSKDPGLQTDGGPDLQVRANSPTMTSPAMTEMGVILGTAAYMSPEQAKGRPVDKRTDIWAFGCVLYEMLTGRRAFEGDDVSDTLANILKSEPQWAALPGDVPEEVRLLVRRCLEKDARARIADLGTARFLLTERIPRTAVPGPSRPRRRGLVLAAVAGLTIGAALALVLAPRTGGARPDLSRYTFTPISLETPTEREPAWSPDGKSLAYVAALNGVTQVMTRALGSAQAAQLTHLTQGAQSPFWSPDGSTIYYTAVLGGSPGLWSVNPTGGSPDLVIEGATSAAIHPNGKTFAYTKGARLFVGGDPRAGGEPPREFGQPPFDPPGGVEGFSPDGSKLAVTKNGDVWVLDYPSGAARRFATSSVRFASWMPDSARLVVSDGKSLSFLDVTSGDERLIYSGPIGLFTPAVSPDGERIAFMSGQTGWDLVEVHVPDGGVRSMPSAGGTSWWPAWAPSGTHYAFASNGRDRVAIWDMSGAGTPGFQRLLVEMAASSVSQVRWAPDGSRFSFAALFSGGMTRLMLANASGGRALPVDEAATMSTSGVWSPDGQWLAYTRTVGADAQLVKIRPGSRPDPQVLKSWTPGSASGQERSPVDWSPDGKWILTDRGRHGGPGLFLVSPDGKTERELSATRGGQGRPTFGFSQDGRAVLYLEHNVTGTGAPWRLWSIDVATGAERHLADVPLPATAGDAAGFSLHPDGTRFLTSIAKWPFDLWMLEGFDR